jgi:hypothetical protein
MKWESFWGFPFGMWPGLLPTGAEITYSTVIGKSIGIPKRLYVLFFFMTKPGAKRGRIQFDKYFKKG